MEEEEEAEEVEETRPGETRSMSGRVEGEGDLLDLRWRRGGRTHLLSSSEKGLVSSVKGLLVEVVLPLSLEQLLPSLFPSSRRLQVPPPTQHNQWTSLLTLRRGVLVIRELSGLVASYDGETQRSARRLTPGS